MKNHEKFRVGVNKSKCATFFATDNQTSRQAGKHTKKQTFILLMKNHEKFRVGVNKSKCATFFADSSDSSDSSD